MNSSKTIRISSGNYEAWVAPEAGARMTKLIWHDGVESIDCLVPCRNDEFDPHDWPKSGAFVMLPFANRLSPASFEWNGATIMLRSGVPNGQGIHGFGHRQSWDVIRTSASSIELSFVHGKLTDEWPWPFRAHISYTLSDSGLVVKATIQNLSSSAMPAILGWHPFIPSPYRWVNTTGDLVVSAKNRYDIGSDGLGYAQISDGSFDLQPFRAMRSASQTTAYENWSGTINVPLDDSHFLSLRSEDTAHLLLHVPTGLEHVCIEPITALPGALQRYSGHHKKLYLSLMPNEHKKFSCGIGFHTIRGLKS